MKGMTGFPVTLLLLFVSLKYFNQHERTCRTVRAVQFEKAIQRPPNRFTANKIVFVCSVKDQIYGSNKGQNARHGKRDYYYQEIIFQMHFSTADS